MLARLVPFVANTTRISADFLNDFQDDVIALFAGTKSIASLLIDGTGDNASAVAAGFASILKGIIVPGGSDSDVALDVQTAPTTWRVIVKAKAGTSTYARLGVTTTGVILTINANYDIANTRWQRDAAGYAMALYLDTSSGGPQLLWYDASSTSNWTSWSMGFRQTLTIASGNLVASVGDLIANAGTVRARRLSVEKGTAFDGSEFVLTGAGDLGSISAYSGNDSIGTATILPNSSGGIGSGTASLRINFKDGAWSTPPTLLPVKMPSVTVPDVNTITTTYAILTAAVNWGGASIPGTPVKVGWCFIGS